MKSEKLNNYFKTIQQLLGPNDKRYKFYDCILQISDVVKISSVDEIPDKSLVKKLKDIAFERFEQKQCYKNSFELLTYSHDENITYCEGYVFDESINVPFPISHAFNCYTNPITKQKIYFDLTFEITLNNDLSECEYILSKTFDYKSSYENVMKYEQYGPWFEQHIIESLKI